MVFGPRPDQIEASVVPIRLLFLHLKPFSYKSVQGEGNLTNGDYAMGPPRADCFKSIKFPRPTKSRSSSLACRRCFKVDRPQHCHDILEQELSLPYTGLDPMKRTPARSRSRSSATFSTLSSGAVEIVSSPHRPVAPQKQILAGLEHFKGFTGCCRMDKVGLS